MRLFRSITAYAAAVVTSGLSHVMLWLARHEVERSGNGLEVLFGIHAIARYLGVTRRQAHVLVRGRLIPTFDLAGAICARKPELRACIDALPRSAGARGTPSR